MADQEPDDNTRTHVVLTQGTMVSHYRIVEKIGAGGMGEVYLAEDSKLSRNVALKFLPTHLCQDEDSRTRFTREAKAAAKLDHPNIVPVYEVGEFQGRPFFAMAHIGGEPLREITKAGKLTVAEAVGLTMQICEGLHEAHDAGIVHRDIKPGNIIIDTKGKPRLLDFGLATVTGEEKLTKTGSTLGTVGYMAPEQISGGKIDKRSDLFSLGVILYEMLTGRRPFEGDNDAAVISAITTSTPEPIARFKSGVTGELQQVINKALAKDPSLRYQHADGMLADLRRLTVETAPPRKNRFALWAAAALVLIIGGYFIAVLMKEPKTVAVTELPVLIVLPFENLGSDTDEYFSDGIRHEIWSRLSTVNGIRVISPRSADQYKETDKSAEQIGQETGADYILEAAIRWDKSGEVDLIRMTPRLTKTSDNYLMWSDNYQQVLLQIFEVQSKIADQIVIALGLTLVETGKLAPDGAPTTNMAAYNFYLRGLEISSHTFTLSDFNSAIEMFDSAIALDSSFALAWAQKSINHSTFNFFFTTVDVKHHKREALRAAEKAMELDPILPSANIAMGTYHNYVKRDYDNALASLYAAKSEVVSNADLSEAIGVVKMRQGEWQEALLLFEEATRIDPLNHRRYYYLANDLSMIRDYELADKYIARALVLDPSNPDAAYMKIFVDLLHHGTVDVEGNSFKKLVTDVGLAEISTYELTSATSLGLWRFIIDRIDPQEALENVRRVGDIRGTITERTPHRVQLNIAQIFDLTGQHDSAQIHYDSSRIILSSIIDLGDFQFHAYAELGLTYALMGSKEEAIEAGKKAKELMSVDDCHW
ncbi:MAG: tetratricopeptide repeat-containing serine/threonine-protein kinase [candidate division Zixibacteria bacterium]|nr:tetratricopeptide repeat-containing serine/threonine-protein kinase [candidate division Zixibacteria bacterium]MDH3937612.1 tetratricopeptide repeat-containing serine/threonine-protein kinase [candidate division Zixibacteria bacterium]MDH4032377.1 tetratricopeptide repeat-containing serine/threonine-protein kinase [candidate division Zixibacteria bacterium]